MNTNADSTYAGLSDDTLAQFVAGISDYAICMLDRQGYIRSWNAGATDSSGFGSSEVIGKHFSSFFSDEARASQVPAQMLQAARDHGSFEGEGWRVRKDGVQVWMNVVLNAVRDDAGELVGFAEISRDITARKAAYEVLRESDQQFRLLVQGVTDYAIYMLSPIGEITNWNAGAQRIKGFSQDEVVGTHFSRFYTEPDRAAGIPARSLSISAIEGRYEQEGWRLRKDGTQFWAHVVVDAIRNEAGDLVGFAKVTRDITERKRAAEALAQANAALFQSQKMEAIGQLTGGIAHDFNNLLAVMASSLDVLSIRLRDSADVKMLDSMRRAVDRGATLTQQLLSFARRQPLKTGQHDLNAVIEGFESVLRRASNSSIRFEVRPHPALRTVSIDAERFEAALLNLVVNARDAMPNGGSLLIATHNVDIQAGDVPDLPAGPYVRVSVTDSGAGMPTDVAARAFEPFFTTKELGKGTGLGLSQVYGFITQSGGSVVLDSEVGTGTTVNMYLPAPVDATPDEHDDTNVENDVDTVLIVEDEPEVRDVAAELLRSIGYRVVTATDGRDAVATLRSRNDIDILFTDVVMPHGMNGIDLARHTRELYPAIRVVLASGYPLPALKDMHGEIDQFPIINKPYRLSEVARKLRGSN